MSTPILPLACVLAIAAGCSSTRSSAGAAHDDGRWLKPSPSLAEQIERNAERLPWTHALEDRMALIQWFVSVGEPAYPTLLALARDERENVAGAALVALGSTGDARLVEPVRSIELASGASDTLGLEHARALLLLGDWSRSWPLIQGLRDERPLVRALCIRALSVATREELGYDPAGPAGEREEAIVRWEEWWRARADDQMLAQVGR